MSVINILAPHVADMIAAGEVVERPASVIKELTENAFDAGAKNITIEIRGGGSALIRVTDDGCGMSPEDAGIAFLRHATSKLKDEYGLESISTMGFRGEALAAISAVSNIELMTRRKEDDIGTRVILSAGDIQDMLPAGCPAGTTMIVRDLFFNTPARLKFLKTDRSESSACEQTALRCALARPDVSVRFIKDGKEVFFSPGDGRVQSAIYTLLGREIAADMLECSSTNNGASVHGFISSPSAGRGNRANQYFFCNGRYIKSQLLQSALEQAYKNTLLTGRYPSCALFVELSFAQVDVNVHPAKTEIKFSDEKKIFDLVYYAVLSALQNENRTASVELSPSTKKVLEPKKDFYQTMSAEEFRANGYAASVKTAGTTASVTPSVKPAAPAASGNSAKNTPIRPVAPAPAEKTVPATAATAVSSPSPVVVSPVKAAAPQPQSPRMEESAPNIPVSYYQPRIETISSENSEISTETAKNVENSVQNVEKTEIPDHKIVGEALRTYIIVEYDDKLLLIDKHAAHERMIFDRLKQTERLNSSQMLLTPITLRLTDEDASVIDRNESVLSALGFEIDPFGERDYIVRSVPSDIDPADVAATVEEICEKFKSGKAPDPAAARDEILHTVACKAAIKAGWDTGAAELEKIAIEVLSGRIKYCPHGRPVSQIVTRRDLDKLFKRIV